MYRDDINPAALPFTLHDPDVLRDAVRALLKALSNTDRLMPLCCMGTERRNVGELEVATEKEGKYVYYRLSDPKALRLMQTLAGIFCAAP
ncbi:MAG: hypothetical protein LBU11_03365 [Zoogloeaceae bacterium]|jgi:DNA-binding transcriptional ArsR family regulator|nr:hypothetical protein [Zoogloeaceae bacterium]